MKTPIITVSTFTYFSADDSADLYICSACASANPQLNPAPATYTYDLDSDAFSSLCDHCRVPIISVS